MSIEKIPRIIISKSYFLFLLLLSLLSGCGKTPQDPLEPLNRGIYGLNKVVDRVLIKTTAQAYEAIIPPGFRKIVGNFFQNLNEIPTTINDVLQGRMKLAAKDAARFVFNTTWGVGGLIDWASKAKLERHQTDFGITLGVWGYKNSWYFVLPFFGPSTYRDTLGRVATTYMSVWPYIESVRWRNGLYILYVIDQRAQYLKLEPVIDVAAVDEYVFIREAYLQQRRAEILDTLLPDLSVKPTTNAEIVSPTEVEEGGVNTNIDTLQEPPA